MERLRPQSLSRNSGPELPSCPSLSLPSSLSQDRSGPAGDSSPAPVPPLRPEQQGQGLAGARALWVVFRQCIKNQGALGGTSSAEKHVSFPCTPLSARVLNKCPDCPCTKPMPQTGKRRLGEVGSQSCDGAKPGLNPQLVWLRAQNNVPCLISCRTRSRWGKGPSRSCRARQGSGLSHQHQLLYKELPGPLSTLHIQTTCLTTASEAGTIRPPPSLPLHQPIPDSWGFSTGRAHHLEPQRLQRPHACPGRAHWLGVPRKGGSS